MKIELKYAELHSPLFLAKTNLGQKLNVEGGKPCTITYDRDNQELHVIYKGTAAIIPHTAVASMEPVDPVEAGITMPKSAPVKAKPVEVAQANGKIKAQVSTPMDIVQGRK